MPCQIEVFKSREMCLWEIFIPVNNSFVMCKKGDAERKKYGKEAKSRALKYISVDALPVFRENLWYYEEMIIYLK